jgi:phage I-like protein
MDKAQDHKNALYANTDYSETLTNVTNLGEGEFDAARPVEFLRIGSFRDAEGKAVEIDAAVLDALVSTFAEGLAGQDVPVDILHRREQAAGWVRRVYRQDDKLLADVEWNALGRQLVGDKVFRYLSATLDLARKVLRSISLVNFPAVKGLSPVELAEESVDAAPPSQLIVSTGQGTALAAPTDSQERSSMAEENVGTAEVIAVQPQAPASAVLSEGDRTALRKQIEAELRATLLAEFEQIEASKARVMAELMEQVRTERELSEFSYKATSEGRFALPVKRDDLQALLSELDKPQRAKVMDLLGTITERGLVDFTERGTSRGSAPQALSSETAAALRNFVANGGSVEVFFEANPELGGKELYDLKTFGGNNG